MLAQRGQSLVSVLVSIGITSIVIAVMTTMFQNQSHETKALTEKLASLDFMRLMTTVLANPPACGAVVAAGNVSGGSLTFVPASITSTDPLKPNIIASFNSLYNADGTSVLASAGSILSPLTNNLALAATNGVQLGAYNQGGSVAFELLVNWDQTKLTRTLRPLALPVVLTPPPTGASVTITGCQGSGTGAPTGSGGEMCGSRLTFCQWPPGAAATYDSDGAGLWASTNVPCQGTTLTATCGGGFGNQVISAVNGCPSGYSGAHNQVTCNNASSVTQPAYSCGGGTNLEVGYIYCRKN